MHMIYLGIAIHVAAGIYVHGMMTTCWISSYTNIRQRCIRINYAHFELILILSIK